MCAYKKKSKFVTYKFHINSTISSILPILPITLEHLSYVSKVTRNRDPLTLSKGMSRPEKYENVKQIYNPVEVYSTLTLRVGVIV